MGSPTDVQKAALLGSFMVMLWSVPGLIVNPDFSVGDRATSARVMGVDMNGWHAVAGFVVVVPVLLAFRRQRLLRNLLAVSAAGLIATAVWALFSTRVAGGLFVFPNNEVDALLHLAVAAIFVWGAMRGRRAHRAAPA